MAFYNQYPVVYLCTLDDLKLRRQTNQADESYTTANDNQLLYFIQQASAEIVSLLQRMPLPYVATHKYDAPHYYEDGLVANLGYKPYYVLHTSDADDLISVTTLTNGDGTTVSSSDYLTYPANTYPKHYIRIKNNSTTTFTYTDVWEQAMSVAGTWGYVPHWDNAWNTSVDTVQDNPLSASATTLNVSDGTNFEVAQYIRIESEYLLITGISTNALTVERGVLGTTAAAHVATTAIDTFKQLNDIRQATVEYADYLYVNKSNVGENVEFFDGGIQVNNGLSPRMLASLRRHRRVVLV